MNRFAAIVLGGGKSTRMLGTDKMNIKLDGKTVLEHSSELFKDFGKLIVVGPSGSVPAGERRQDSVYNALMELDENSFDYVLIHDGARPFADAELVKRVVDGLLSGADAVIPCVRPKDTIRTASETLDRDGLYAVQTPQGFKTKLIKDCYIKAKEEGFCVTDDASVAEYCGVKISMVEGSYKNYKITTPDDVPKRSTLRIGNGYDVHRLAEGRALMLGCVEIPYEKGLLGHSDADVIAHAIADAMLGSAALGDIGKIFPDNAKETEGMSGREILRKTAELLAVSGFRCINIDATLAAEKPKVSPYTDAMRRAIAEAVNIDVNNVSVKATTEEGLGITGGGLAMAAYASVLAEEIK